MVGFRPSAVLAIYNTDPLKANMELISHLLEDAVESLHFFFLLSPPHAGPLRVSVIVDFVL